MDRHVIIGTAGHVDHGKTALVRALTGTDTDRWEEEKRRGITIDLGFASLELGDGLSASIVDVPGHEDFVRNMVAGATGVDVALLVVAADEGLMPQTEEHLSILELLAVRAGVVALTKCDLVEDDWLELVEADIADRLAASSIHWEGTVRFSAVERLGHDELISALAGAAGTAAARSSEDLFRLPVDRVFSVAGAGTVVTGTTWSGTVRVGDEVKVLPGSDTARVRGIEVHGEACEAALPGRRTALALAGLDRKRVARGHVVVAHEGWRETGAMDVMLTLLPAAPRAITQRSRIRFHLGTAEVMARVTPTGGEIEPGSSGAARLRLEAPLVGRWGDRGVIRSYSPPTTIGGCVVVDPWPTRRPRRPVGLAARAVADPRKRLAAFVEAAGSRGLGPEELTVRVGLSPAESPAFERSSVAGIVWGGGRLFSPAVVRGARGVALATIERYHNEYPLRPGMPRELARRDLGDADFADFIHRELEQEGLIAVEQNTVRLVNHSPELSGDQIAYGNRVAESLRDGGKHGRSLAELQELGIENLMQILDFLVNEGSVVRLTKDRYYDGAALEKLTRDVLDAIGGTGQATPADLREATGLSRKYLIPLMEWMDGRSLTVRNADARVLGPAGKAILESS
ncbi:MAG: selenocysteine-specific translation elongation factor [Gemmatimonadales bacterium]